MGGLSINILKPTMFNTLNPSNPLEKKKSKTHEITSLLGSTSGPRQAIELLFSALDGATRRCSAGKQGEGFFFWGLQWLHTFGRINHVFLFNGWNQQNATARVIFLCMFIVRCIWFRRVLLLRDPNQSCLVLIFFWIWCRISGVPNSKDLFSQGLSNGS